MFLSLEALPRELLLQDMLHGQKNACTVLVTIKLPFYARATGTGTGVARVRVRASHGYGYGRSTGTGTGVARLYVATYCRYSYGRMTDTALRGVAYVRSCDLYALCGISH